MPLEAGKIRHLFIGCFLGTNGMFLLCCLGCGARVLIQSGYVLLLDLRVHVLGYLFSNTYFLIYFKEKKKKTLLSFCLIPSSPAITEVCFFICLYFARGLCWVFVEVRRILLFPADSAVGVLELSSYGMQA